MLQNNSNIKSLIAELWQNFWSGGISNPLIAIEQITYLIFMKRIDDLEAKRERDAEFTGKYILQGSVEKYKILGSNDEVDKSELRWTSFKWKPAEEMLLHLQTKVFPFLKEMNGGSTFTTSMANAVFIMPKPSLLVEAINIIEQLFTEIERDATEGGQTFQDIQGDVYELLLSEIASAGKNGQFRTPRHIIKLMTELIDPQLGQRMTDPSCGTAGFILGFYQYILTTLVRRENPGRLVIDEDGFERATFSGLLTEQVKEILESTLYGFNIEAGSNVYQATDHFVENNIYKTL